MIINKAVLLITKKRRNLPRLHKFTVQTHRQISVFRYFESYFHPRIGLTGKEDFARPLYDIIEQDYHVVPVLSREKIRAKSASAITAKRLKIRNGDPVLVRERFVFDPGNRPIEYNIGFYIAEKFTYSIDIKR